MTVAFSATSSTPRTIPLRCNVVILRYSEESARLYQLARCFGVPQHDTHGADGTRSGALIVSQTCRGIDSPPDSAKILPPMTQRITIGRLIIAPQTRG